MSTTTQQTKAAAPVTKAASTIMKQPALPPIVGLQSFLTDAYNAEKVNLEPSSMVIGGFTLKSKKAAISIIMIDTNRANNIYAEIDGTLMHYSGSLLKVAALYAAYDLRAAARMHAKGNNFANPNAFFTSFLPTVDTSTAIKRIRDFGKGLKPELATIFKPTAPDKVEFLPSFQIDLNKIGDSDNAGRVIRALGYSYINVSMIRGKFFTEAAAGGLGPLNGVWLAGDYSGETNLKSVRVPVENDTVPDGSGQATTTKEMCRMFQLLHVEEGLTHVTDATEKAAANKGAHDILITEGSFFQNGTSTVQITVTPAFTKHCAKVGIGLLGPIATPGPKVISEGAVMKWTDAAEVAKFNEDHGRSLTGDFALVWQNMYPPNSHFDALVRLLNSAIQKFLTQP
jgi:hypothetical protein